MYNKYTHRSYRLKLAEALWEEHAEKKLMGGTAFCQHTHKRINTRAHRRAGLVSSVIRELADGSEAHTHAHVVSLAG